MTRKVLRIIVHTCLIVIAFSALWPQSAHAQSVASPHGDLKVTCQTCHSTDNWQTLRRPLAFVHDSTLFPLIGRHQDLACIACHSNPVFAAAETQCMSCHDDIHRGQFGNSCEQCHTPANWSNRIEMVENHQKSQFPLLGMHGRIDCQSCHAGGQFAGLSANCSSCHISDYRATTNPNHAGAGFSTSCTECHSATAETWDGPTFAHTTRFPLTGGHEGPNCAACHTAASYASTSAACYSCHNDDFAQTQNPSHAEGQFSHDCEICHSTIHWQPANFDHDLTSFPLTGGHRQANCAQCHTNGEYPNTPSDCWSCHEAQYMSATNLNHAQNRLPHQCEICHTTVDWQSPTFVHEHFGFPLTGRHAQTQCAECHVGGRFTGTPIDCWSCHEADFHESQSPNHDDAQMAHACQECHTTNGWTPSTFDHAATQFPLTGAHVLANCQQCHIGGQFAGTATDCWSCHEADYNATDNPDHEAAQISHACAECHGNVSWVPSVFNHGATDFPLTGAHIATSCQQCHVGGQFANTPTTCLSCHEADYNDSDDPDHQDAGFATTCQSCHTTTNWDAAFDHNQTDFPLTGAHIAPRCNACHISGPYQNTSTDCWSCHQADYQAAADPEHAAAQIPHNCAQCHNTASWQPSTFSHDATDFPLTGRHLLANCQQCHIAGEYANTQSECWSCHNTDYNEATNPDHATAQISHNCNECHTTNAWTPSSFDHAQTNFPLTGAHVLSSCQQCHLGGEFAGTPTDCWSCHHADYNSTDAPDHEAAQISHTCTECHTTNGWQPSTFQHDATDFPLTGAHLLANCQQCHINGQFQGTPTACLSCHEQQFHDSDDPDHENAGFQTNCQTCHTTTNWLATFDHNQTDFPLTGAHVTPRCIECHISGPYSQTSTECWFCHQQEYSEATIPDHIAANLPHNCAQCHNTQAWLPGEFDHNGTNFPLTGAHVLANCQQCHINGQFVGTPTDCWSCHEADYNDTDNPDHEAAHISQTCTECHTTAQWSPSTFSHSATDFPLTGAHVLANCQQCHINGQFAGTPNDCWSCHEANYNNTESPDHEAAQISQACAECHTTAQWSPSTFSHNATNFPLTGAHILANCQQCHINGQFAETPADCWSCHEAQYRATLDPDHEAAEISHQCNQCHATTAWTPGLFDHSATEFPLTGAHVLVNCQQCHSNGQFEGTPTACVGCHQNDYDSSDDPSHPNAGFSTTCQSCHNTNDWHAVFDHNQTGFQLVGAHVSARCNLCHSSGPFSETPTDCWSCHQTDYGAAENPSHSAGMLPHNCSHCHNSNSWTPSTFSHDATSFPLTGAHVQASCQQCHNSGQFDGTPTNCWSCHQSDYNSSESPDHEAGQLPQACGECHMTTTWSPSSFSHNATAFPLTGAHVLAACQQCHIAGQFAGTPSECWSCHQADYSATDDPDHEAAQISHTCNQCHSTTAWTPGLFDHATTDFPLTGAHVLANCQQCHIAGQFEGTAADCWSCHAADYNASTAPDHEAGQLPQQCTQCHTTTSWVPSTFDHATTAFPLTGAHISAACQQCHIAGQFVGIPSQCANCHQADYANSDDPNHQLAGFSMQCQSCHTTTNWQANYDHSQTGFPLIGAHAGARCNSCHIAGPYGQMSAACWSCHEADYRAANEPDHDAAQLPQDCAQCHTQQRWTPSTFNHSSTAFPLSGAHMVASCQQCHVAGQFDGTPTDCWSCHQTDFAETTDPDHEAAQIPHQCNQCHSTTAWVPGLFDHASTNFPLTGAHVSTSCQQCHANGQFENTPTDCWFCHQGDFNDSNSPDHEAGQLPHACTECHTTAHWVPSTFDHAATAFPLTGAHRAVNCQQCHTNGQFDGTPSTCVNCHAADYNSSDNPDHDAAGFSTACQTCHTTTNWNSNFNHNNTDFPLTGAHISASCVSCHSSGQYNNLPSTCVSCHQADYNASTDPDHEAASFPTTCQTCHTTTNWNSNFNHNNTDFPLTGAHISASCVSCHSSGQYNNLPSTCVSCHQADYNGTTDPDHDAAGFSTACQTCHTTTNWNSNFNHNNTDFPLTGAHINAACLQCHSSGQYNNLPSTCVSCHQADYNGTTDPDHDAANFPTTCQTCHTTTNWNSNFNHNNTDFPLTGAHINTACLQCHSSGQYNNLPSTCVSCHQADYNGTTDPDHDAAGFSTACQTCHTTTNWNSNFNHNNTDFPLTGAHISAACLQCHSSGQYNGLPTACWSCHQADFNGATDPPHASDGFPHNCEMCHTTSNWNSNFNHDGMYFPIYSGSHRNEWNTCSECHTISGNFTAFSCIGCHEHRQSSMDSHHREVNGYAYESNACYSCHPNGRH